MKKFIPLASLLFVIFCSSCKGIISRFKDARGQRVDTSDCAALVSMKPSGAGTWFFTLKNAVTIKNDTMPSLRIDLQKESGDEYEGFDNITISFEIDSPICVDKGSFILIGFADSTAVDLANYGENNCDGMTLTSFREMMGGSENEKEIRIKKMHSKKIKYVALFVHDGYRLYTLDDTDATNLLYLINCLGKAK